MQFKAENLRIPKHPQTFNPSSKFRGATARYNFLWDTLYKPCSWHLHTSTVKKSCQLYIDFTFKNWQLFFWLGVYMLLKLIQKCTKPKMSFKKMLIKSEFFFISSIIQTMWRPIMHSTKEIKVKNNERLFRL